MASRAPAQTNNWIGNSGSNWNSALNWTNGVPTATSNVVFNPGFLSPILAGSGTAATLTFNSGSTNYTLTSSGGSSLSGVSVVTVVAGTTGVSTIDLATIATGSLLFPSGQNLTFTNNADATAATAPTLVIGPNTVIGTPGSGGLVFGGTGTTTVNGSFSTTGPPNNQVVGGITKNGPGTLVLSGNGSNLVGGLTFNGGTVRLDYATNTATKFTGNFFSTGGEIVMAPHATTAITQTASASIFSDGATSFRRDGSGSTTALNLGSITRSPGATFNVTSGVTLLSTTGNTNGLLGTGPAFATVDGTLWARNDGTNTITGVGNVNDTFGAGFGVNLTMSQSVGTATTNSVRFGNGGVTLTQSGTLTLQSGGILVPTGLNGSTIAGGTLTTPGGTGEVIVHAYGPLTVNGNVSTSGGLTKTGFSDLTFTPSNFSLLSGNVNINQGTLRLVVNGTNGDTVSNLLKGSVGSTFAKSGTGTLTLTNASNSLGIFRVEAGTLTIPGGGSVISQFSVIAPTAGSTATVNVGGTGAVWNTGTSELRMGEFGNGTLTITGGGTVTSGISSIGTFAGSTGAVSVGGGTGVAVWNLGTAQLQVGVSGNGSLTITGGGTVASGFSGIGLFAGSTGAARVGGGSGAAAWNLGTSSLVVGEQGNGTLTVTGGGTVTSGIGAIGGQNGSNGTATVGGGSGTALWDLGVASLRVGEAGTGRLFLNNGGTVSAGSLDNGNATSSVNFDGGNLRIIATDSASNTINVLAGGGTLDLPTTNTTFFYGGTLAGSGTLTKTGRGTLAAIGNGTAFTGGLTVADGLLELSNDAALGTATLGAGPFGVIRYTATAGTGRRFQLTGGVLQTAAGTTLTLQNGAEVAGGFLNSNVAGVFQSGPGGATIRNATVYTGTTVNIQSGPLAVSNLTFGGTMTVTAGQSLTGENVLKTSSSQFTVNGNAVLSNLTSQGRITINSGGILLQSNANAATPLTLGGGSVTTVNSGGTLNLGGSGATQLGRLAGGVLINSGNVTGGRLVVDFGGLARGTGSYSVNPLTVNGGQFSPGSSPGRVNVEAFIADAGGSYLFEINDGTPGFEGPTGTSNLRGWDLTTVRDNTTPANAAFFIDATPSNRFTINLRTLTAPSPPDVNGNMDNFNPNAPVQWLAFSVDPAATNPFPNGFDPNAFAVNASGFSNPTNGSFGVARVGNDVFITYAPVPEPGLMLVAAAGALALFVRRRSRRIV